MSDGAPQVQPVWCSFDGTHILVNTEKGRQKYRNMSRRPAVTILAIDPDNDSRWLEVRGTVVGETEEGANEHIDELARLYLGVDKYPFHQEGDVRVLFKIAPMHVATMESTMPDFSTST
jgi:PPOX class probable F420-dependent enzyme